MILLNGQSMAIKDRFPVESMPLNLEEKNSSATITIGPDAPDIAIGDWLKDDCDPGKGIVWRVKTVLYQVETRTRTVTLEHPIQILKDYAIFGEVKPGTMAGDSRADKCTARQAISYALGLQGIWRLGDLAENPSKPYSFNGDSVFAAVETVTGSLDGCQWEYDLGSLPFLLHIRKAPAEFSSEMRMSRNITTIRKQIDRTRMYTRHYPIGANNLHIAGEYLSKNENIWGRVDKVETDQSQDTEEKLRAWSQERLNRHCEPLVTVTVGGLELSADTGEPLDHIVVGRRCRLPLPEYGTTITERVTKISWADKIKDPQKVTVTLANLVEDVASIVNSLASSTGRAGRAGAKKQQEDHAWFVDTTEKVQMVAEAVAGKDEDGNANWSRVSELTVDGSGIDARVTYAEGKIVTHATRIRQTEEAITLEANYRSMADAQLSGRITVAADAITAEVTRATEAEGVLSGRITTTAEAINAEVTRATGAESSLSGRITVNANKVGMVVETKNGQNVIKSASIVAAINADGSSEASITADHVTITGATKINGAFEIDDNGYLKVKKTAIFQGNLTLTTAFSEITAPNYVMNSGGHIRMIGGGSGEYYDLTATALKGMVKSFSVSGNVLTLTPWYGEPVNFSKAVSLSGAWGSGDDIGKYVVTATENGETVATHKYDPPLMLIGGTPPADNFSAWIYESGNPPIKEKEVNGYLKLEGSTSGSYVRVYNNSAGTGTALAQISVGSLYTDGYNTGYYAGWDTAAGLTEFPGSGSGTSFDVKAPKYYEKTQGTWVREQVTATYILTKGTPGPDVKVAVSSAGVTVAQLDISNVYTAGVTAGKNAVVITKGSWNAGQVAISKSEGTASTVTVQLTAAAPTWSGNTASVKIWDGTAADTQHGSDTGYTVTVDASRVSVSSIVFEATDIGGSAESNDNAITAKAKNGSGTVLKTETQVIHMHKGGWDEGKIGVTCRMNDSDGACIDRIYISLPATSSFTKNYTGSLGSLWKNVGSVSIAALSGGTYMYWKMGGLYYYITVNN